MKMGNTMTAAIALAMGAALWTAPHAAAQQPEFDVVHITLPYAVTLGGKTLPPGDYTVQEQRREDSTVLEFYNGTGMKWEASAQANKALDPNTARSTAMTLHHIGDDYYFDKLWIQGKEY